MITQTSAVQRLDTHPRTLRANIWRGVLSATDQELHDGMHFYEGAHGLCRLVAAMFRVTVEQVAGVYAALSPMNGWLTNVANVFDVFRHVQRNDAILSFPKVNTTKRNLEKALWIVSGKDPLAVLRGRKVTAFYHGIVNPFDTTPVPVDRHLINLALGTKVTANVELRSLAGNVDLYTRIESAYTDLGQREGIGNRLASIAWFVQRRVSQGQTPILQPSRLVCCQRPMHRRGRKGWGCGVCRSTVSHTVVRHNLPRRAKSIPITYYDGHPVTVDNRGRRRVYLGVGHALANTGGWQYLSRYKVMCELQRVLGTDEHVHHQNLDKGCDTTDNYKVLLAERHGKYHSYIAEVAGGRGPDGRFVEYDVPIDLLGGVDVDTFDSTQNGM